MPKTHYLYANLFSWEALICYNYKQPLKRNLSEQLQEDTVVHSSKMAQHSQECVTVGWRGVFVAGECGVGGGQMRDAARNLGGIQSRMGGFVYCTHKFGFTLWQWERF